MHYIPRRVITSLEIRLHVSRFKTRLQFSTFNFLRSYSKPSTIYAFLSFCHCILSRAAYGKILRAFKNCFRVQKEKVYVPIMRPVVLCGSETWILTQSYIPCSICSLITANSSSSIEIEVP